MSGFAEKDMAKLNEHDLAELARDEESLYKIGDVLRKGSSGDTDFGSVKIMRGQFERMQGEGVFNSIRDGILKVNKGRISDVTFDFKPNGSPEIGTVKVTVTCRPEIPGGRLSGIAEMYSATHSISSRLRKG
ncbi:MAG: hypothetical protein KGH94_05175 [Candidatus Micrarchaeota archaeon]|nr:hypothetical protein [Candidatus Micrarchaeota archaeon]